MPPQKLTLKVLNSGPIANHVIFSRTAVRLAYLSVGALTKCRSSAPMTFRKWAAIGVGRLPHDVWPSDDGTRMYGGLENKDSAAIQIQPSTRAE